MRVTSAAAARGTVASLVLCVLLSVVSSSAKAGCSPSAFEQCRTCPGLGESLDPRDADAGDFFSGSYWNGLYAAYRLNCYEIGRALLARGANPNLGGFFGSFLVTLVQRRHPEDVATNLRWAKLVAEYSINPDWKNPYQDASATQLIASGLFKTEYPEVWAILTKH